MIRLRPSDPRYPMIDALQTMLCVALNPGMHIYGNPLDTLYPAIELHETACEYLERLEELFDMIEASYQ
jgi:hypothetical protein